MILAPLSKEELLERLPQKAPFRFVDKILHVDENHIVGEYTFRKEEYFYQGHFPEYPITPGVILLEAMGQVGLVAFGIYLLSCSMAESELIHFRTVFSDATVEFYLPVFPGDQVVMRGEKVFFRQKKLRAKMEMFRGNDLVATCTASGFGVRK
jgi:3-hydroxyacyl-[acyl-carrier-protein] dehydratase